VSKIKLSKFYIKNIVKLALNEDLYPSGDITSNLVKNNKIIKIKLISNQKAVIGGLEFAKQTFKLIDKKIKFNLKKKEGSSVKKNDLVATIEGKAQNILIGERVALNFVSHISGIATKTNAFVKLAGKNCKICCTRKTVPNLRVIQKYAVKLGFMSFFVKASVVALKNFPSINAEIEGDHIIYKNYYNISIAIGTDRGLVVPVLKKADELSFADIERNIFLLSEKAQKGKITINDLQGGTFTISNGGIYGSMLSTPILNPPQTGILGMHNIVERPIVKEGSIVIRPIMYLALSYDHRIIDGKEAVSFLKTIKECLEEPRRLFLDL